MKTSLNIKYSFLFVLPISFAVMLAERYLAFSVNKEYLNAAFVFTGTGIVLLIYFFVQEANKNTRIQADLALRQEYLSETLISTRAVSEMQSSILDALPANIALLDKNGVIIDVNESWIRFGHENCLASSQYGIGDNYIDEADKASGESEETGKQMARAIKDVINGNIPSFELEYECHSPNKKRWYKAVVSPLIKKGQSGAVVMHTDITERKLAEIALNNMNNELEMRISERVKELNKANSELEAFSYTVSHDLQTPLRIVNGFSKILLNDYNHLLDDTGKKHLAIIRDSVKKMSDLIRELLAFAKLGKSPIETTETNMDEVVETIISESKLSGQDYNATIILNNLGAACCDPVLIKQVWSNLISNALKYSKKKEQPVVEIGKKIIGGKPTYYVQDNGAGFDMQYAHNLFAVFKRLHTDADFEGTGVGLATVHRILSKHGGEIWAEAELNKGATFYFALPGVPVNQMINA